MRALRVISNLKNFKTLRRFLKTVKDISYAQTQSFIEDNNAVTHYHVYCDKNYIFLFRLYGGATSERATTAVLKMLTMLLEEWLLLSTTTTAEEIAATTMQL